MNDFVLRGFCKKCESSVIWETTFCNCEDAMSAKIVWFLSPKQMKILTIKFGQMFADHLATLLEENPFLVAKILKEAGERIEGEKK